MAFAGTAMADYEFTDDITIICPVKAGGDTDRNTRTLAEAMAKIGKNAVIALREPSLGPVFGVKGGAAGGGYAQVVPMEDLNLHFTGDFHAIGATNNLLAAMLDNHIQQGNSLGIDVKKITWKRCVDMNDRQLRNVVDGLGGKMQGVPREDGFDITVASEIMAVLCLATSITDLIPAGYLNRVSKTQLTEMIRKRKDTYRRYRDLSIFAFIGVYLISVVDAYVDAELSNFDIGPDLSMRIEPTVINTSAPSLSKRNVGVQCSFCF